MVVRASTPQPTGARLLVAAVLLVLAAAVVQLWPMGPILVLATEHHGVHLGDLLVLFPAAALAHPAGKRLARAGRSWRQVRPRVPAAHAA